MEQVWSVLAWPVDILGRTLCVWCGWVGVERVGLEVECIVHTWYVGQRPSGYISYIHH